MKKFKLNHQLQYRVVIYLRMSDEKQNQRSPDQQEYEINQTLKRLGLTWIVVKVYRDEYKSGRYERKRSGYMQMMHDIKSGLMKVDLILVDTAERFGRLDNFQAIRDDLQKKHGVLILTAESNFADPTTPQGKVYSAFDSLRASEENRIKSHQVIRGKRDQVLLGFWPGGPKPFGYAIIPVFEERNGITAKIGSKLEPLPEEVSVIRILFDYADQTGYGPNRLTKYLNEHPEIPEKFKPFNSSTIGRWLSQSLYHGELLWNEHCTDVVDDARTIEKNPEEDWIIVPEFCEPIIPEELWNSVQAIRNLRKRPLKKEQDQKLIKPAAPGKSLIYPLSGLVRCGTCDSSMRPIKSGRQSKTGKTYTYYVCPRGIDRNCENRAYIPEKWLRETVFNWIKQQLFPEIEN